MSLPKPSSTMTTGTIHDELRASRPWMLMMAAVALALLPLWGLVGVAGTLGPGLQSLNEGEQGLGTFLRLGFAQLALIAPWGLIPFVNLMRLARHIGKLDAAKPSSLIRVLELNRTFWAQAEILGWAAAWLMAYLFVGSLLFATVI